MKLLIPYWGTDSRHKELLFKWLEAYRKSGCDIPFAIISDHRTEPFDGLPWEAYQTPDYSTHYPFDNKGAIVCRAIVDTTESVLVLDADAFIQRCPREALEKFEHIPFAMPEDEGRRGLHLRNRHAQETDILKRCAGVLWFGAGNRQFFADEYKREFQEMQSGRWYEPRHLYEQHAWTLVAHWYKAPLLPRVFNWASHIASVGPNPDAFINHHVGQRKFNLASRAVRP